MRSSGLPKASRFLHTQKCAPLWEAAELSVIRTLPLSLQGSDNAALTGNLPNILLSGLFRSATEPDNKTFDRRFALIIVAVAAIISAKAPVNAALALEIMGFNFKKVVKNYMENRMKKIIMCVVFIFSFSPVAQAELPKEDIKFITSQAIVLCKKIQFEGNNKKIDISGSASIALNKIAKLFADASIDGKGQYYVEEYKGFIQDELLSAYNSNVECRRNFSTKLLSLLINNKEKECKNPVYNIGRGEVCGVERYNSEASSNCEVLEYNTGSSAECGADQYHVCETGSCGWNSCGFIKKCDAKECRAVVCGVERYKTCQHPSFGVKSYKVCRNENHGVEVYKACRDEEFGMESCG